MLALFLRAQVDASGKTLKTLAEQVHVSKSQISQQLAGKVPGRRFVTDLIRATIPEPRLRERRLDEAGKLLRAALSPSPDRTSPAPVRSPALELAEVRAQQVDVYDRLTRSLEQQNQLREAAGNSAKLVMVLLTMINKLEGRISDLTDERDQLRASHADPTVLRQTQHQLTRAREQEQRAEQELQRAQEKQRQAEELAERVQARVDELTDQLDRLRSGAADGTRDEDRPAVPRPVQARGTADPVGDDIEQALRRASAVNDQDGHVLRDIAQDFAQDPAEVVPEEEPDNPAGSHFSEDNVKTIWPAIVAAGQIRGDYREAVRLSTLLVAASKKTGRPEDPLTLAVRHTLAHWRGKAGDASGAAEAFAELLSVRKRVLGPEHPDTLATRHNLAGLRGEAGDVAGAVEAFAELVPVLDRVMGPEHPATLATRHNLANWRGSGGGCGRRGEGFRRAASRGGAGIGPGARGHAGPPAQLRRLAR